MRWSIAVAAGLFASNIVVLELRKVESQVTRCPVTPAAVARPVPDKFHVDETQRLVWLSTAWRTGYRPKHCVHHDPLAVLDADVDPTPGREHVIGNREYGVAMYAESGALIAFMHPVGCGSDKEIDGDQSLSLSFDHRLIVTTHDASSGARTYTAHIAEREGDLLVERLVLRVGESSPDRETAAKLHFNGTTLEAITHGRERAGDGWRGVDDHCTYDLVTRSSSCRTRAAERTSAPE